MELQQYLTENRKKLVDSWITSVIETYPPESVKFFKTMKDPFSNPVGSTIRRSIDLLFTEITKDKMDSAAVNEALEPIVRLRAVQEFTPSQAISFVFTIKHLLRKALAKQKTDTRISHFLSDVEANTEELLLTALDIYGKCREKIYNLRINQAKNSLNKLLIKKELMSEVPGFDPEPPA